FSSNGASIKRFKLPGSINHRYWTLVQSATDSARLTRPTRLEVQLCRISVRHQTRRKEGFLLFLITEARFSRILIGHQKDQRTHVLLRCPFPVAAQDCVNNQAGFPLAEEDITHGLRHKAAPREAYKDRYRV